MNYDLKKIIDADLHRWGEGIGSKSLLKNILINPNFKFMYMHRKCNYYRDKNRIKYFIYRLKLFRLNLKYGFEISNAAKIGKGFKIDHRGSIIINPNAVIGENVNVTSGVLIGQQNRGSKKGSPTIGNKVWIGANVTIVGKITIGDNVLIAPGSFINSDIPSNSIVIGNPAEIKKSMTATDSYIGWILE